MSYLSLADAKQHARVTISDDDDLIQAKIDTAENWIEGYLGVTLASLATGDPATLPAPVTEATKQLLLTLYDQREATIVGQTITQVPTDPGFYALLSGVRTYVF